MICGSPVLSSSSSSESSFLDYTSLEPTLLFHQNVKNFLLNRNGEQLSISFLIQECSGINPSEGKSKLLAELKVKLMSFEGLNGIQEISEDLLEYSEILRRQGRPEPAEVIDEYVFKSALFSFLSELDRTLYSKHLRLSFEESRDVLRACLDEIESLEARRKTLIDFEVQDIPFSSIYTLLKKALPKKTLPSTIFVEAQALKKSIQEALEESFFQKDSAQFIHHDSCITWVQTTAEGTWIVCYPKAVASETSWPKESLCFDLFVPKMVTDTPVLGFCKVQSVTREMGQQEVVNRNKMSGLLLSDRFLSPAPIISSKEPYLLKKASNYKNLEDILVENPFSLSVLEAIWICTDVALAIKMLASSHFECRRLNFKNIVIVGDKETLEAKLDSFYDATSSSSNKNLKGLLPLMSKLLFYQEKVTASREEQEKHLLKELKLLLLPIHYEQVRFFKDRHNGFQGDFSKDLLNYVTTLKEIGEADSQVIILEQIALRMELFCCLISALVEASNVEDPLIGYDRILKALKEGELIVLDLMEQSLKRECTSVRDVDIDLVNQMARVILPSNYQAKEAKVKNFHLILNDAIKNPHVGTKIRLKKGTFWKDTKIEIPFSCWVEIRKNTLDLTLFSLKSIKPLVENDNSKVKKGVLVEIPMQGPYNLLEIAITRVQKAELIRRYKRQDAVVRMDSEMDHLHSSFKQFSSYKGSHALKWESKEPFYEDFSSILQDPSYTPLDFISLLQEVSEGLALMHKHEIVHENMQPNSILLSPQGDGSVKAILRTDSYIEPSKMYQNALAKKSGVISKETDVYGLVLMISESLLFGFKEASYKSKEELYECCIEQLQEICPDLKSEDVKNQKLLIEKLKEAQAPLSIEAKKLLIQAALFSPLFDLLNRTLEEDQKSLEDYEEDRFNEIPSEKCLAFCSEDVCFPTIQEVQTVLQYCREIATSLKFDSIHV